MKKERIGKKHLSRILIVVLLSLCAILFIYCIVNNLQTKDNFVLKENPFSQSQSNRIKELLLKKPTKETPDISIEENGRLEYYNYDSIESEFDMEEEAAIDFAKNELKELGILPNREYRIEADVIQSFEKSVYFYHTYNGLDIISDEEDGIIVRINKNGLKSLQYYWSEIVPVSGTNSVSDDSMIDESEAIEIYKRELAKNHPEIAEEVENWPVVVSKAYRYTGGKSVKVWVCSDGELYLNSIFVDMLTGELV